MLAFETLDLDNTGFLTKETIRKALGEHMTEEELNEMVLLLPVSLSFCLSFCLSLCLCLSVSVSLSLTLFPQVREIDLDGDGQIDYMEFVKFVSDLPPPLPSSYSCPPSSLCRYWRETMIAAKLTPLQRFFKVSSLSPLVPLTHSGPWSSSAS
jgi:hypothetical protein